MHKVWLIAFLVLSSSFILYNLPSARAAVDCTRSGFRWGLSGGGQGGGLGYLSPYNWPGNRPSDTDVDTTNRWNQIASASASLGVGWYRENLEWSKIQPTITSSVGTPSYASYLSMSEDQINPIIDSFAFPDRPGATNPFQVDKDRLLRHDIMVRSLTNAGICFVGMLAPGVSRDLPFCDGTLCPSGNKVSPSGLGADNYLGLVYLFSRAMVRRYSSMFDVRHWQIENEIDLTLGYELIGWRQWDLLWTGLATVVTSQGSVLNSLWIDVLMSTLSRAVKTEGTHLQKQLWVIHNYGNPMSYLGFIGAQYVDIIGVDIYNGKFNLPPNWIGHDSALPANEGDAVGAIVQAAKFWGKPVWVMEAGYSTNSVFFGTPMPESEQNDYDYHAALSASGVAAGYFLFSPTSCEGGCSPPDENGYGVIKPTYNTDGSYAGPRNTPAWNSYASVITCTSASPPTCSGSSQPRQIDDQWPTVGEVPVENFTSSASPEQWRITSNDPQISQRLFSLVDTLDIGDHSIQEVANPNMSADLLTTLATARTITGVNAIHVETKFGIECNAGGTYTAEDASASVQIYDETSQTVAQQWTKSQCDNRLTGTVSEHWQTFSADVLLNSADQYSVRLVAVSDPYTDSAYLYQADWEYVHISVNDFGVSAPSANNPNYTWNITQGSGVGWGISYSSIGVFQSPITLSYSWDSPAPSGVSVTFDNPTANPLPGSDSIRMPTVYASTTASTGSYKLHITGTTSYGLSHDVWFNFKITVWVPPPGGGGGSIMAGTQVLLSNGSSIAVQNVAAGFMSIRSYDPAAGRFYNASVTSLLLKSVNNLYIIGTDHGNPIRVDYYESFWVQLPNGQQQWMYAGALQTGDKILRPVDGTWANVTFINIASGSFTVYDLIITPTLQDPPGAMPVIANGYLDMKTCGC